MNKKILYLYKMQIIGAIISLFLGVLIFALLYLGVVYTWEADELGEGIAKGVGILFFALYLIGESIVSLYIIIEGNFWRAMLKKGKLSNALLIVNGIIKIVFAIFSGIMAVLEISLYFFEAGAFAILYTIYLIIVAILSFKACQKRTVS